MVVIDNSIRIVKGGVISGDEKALGKEIPATIDYIKYGGENDLWGLTWTAGDINSSDFGVAISYSGAEHTTYYLKSTNFGFNIPKNSVITGIIVEPKTILKTGILASMWCEIYYLTITVYYRLSKSPVSP